MLTNTWQHQLRDALTSTIISTKIKSAKHCSSKATSRPHLYHAITGTSKARLCLVPSLLQKIQVQIDTLIVAGSATISIAVSTTLTRSHERAILPFYCYPVEVTMETWREYTRKKYWKYKSKQNIWEGTNAISTIKYVKPSIQRLMIMVKGVLQ